MRELRGDHDQLTCANGHFVVVALAEPKMQGTLENIGNLLVLMRVPRDIVARLKIHVGNHHSLAAHESPRDCSLEGFERNEIPAMMCSAHVVTHFNFI